MSRREILDTELDAIIAALRDRAMSFRQVASAWDAPEGNIPKALGVAANAARVHEDLMRTAQNHDRLATELAEIHPGRNKTLVVLDAHTWAQLEVDAFKARKS